MTMFPKIVCSTLLLGISFVLAEEAPRLDLPNLDSGYHGLVRENETLVEVTPTIRALGDVCSFRIVNKHHGDAPFQGFWSTNTDACEQQKIRRNKVH
ncbi:hypothetical protein M8J76_000734 [Diaphorina citri]|nr:hypothetical protein M8J76_000734 [Diaphorina citri]